MRKSGLVFALFLAICHGAAIADPNLAPSGPRFNLEIAGFDPGPETGLVTGWNNFGEAAFSRPRPLPFRSYWWNGEVEIELPSDDSRFTTAVGGLNDDSRIAGYVTTSSRSKAVIWDEGNIRVLGTLGGLSSAAYAVNQFGTVAGKAQISNGDYHLFTWNETFKDLGQFPNVGSGSVKAMNDRGEIVGISQPQIDGWIWSEGQVTMLPDLQGGRYGSPEDIGNSGLVVGSSYIQQSDRQPVTWRNGQISALPKLPGTIRGNATSINDDEWIVGFLQLENFNAEAALWIDNQAYFLRDLVNDIGDWRFSQAEKINDRGQIVAFGISQEFGWHRVILTPVPEPSSLALIGILAVVALFGRHLSSPYMEQ